MKTRWLWESWGCTNRNLVGLSEQSPYSSALGLEKFHWDTETSMFGRIASAPTVMRRAFGPLGLAIGGGYLAKKYYDSRKRRRTGGTGY